MKKLALAVAVIAAALTLSGCAKKYTPWENTLEDAKTIASKRNVFPAPVSPVIRYNPFFPNLSKGI